jgi:D-citramalate synthase
MKVRLRWVNERFIFNGGYLWRLVCVGKTWGIALSNSLTKKIKVLDTTLRDGEQTPGVSLTPEKKLLIARQLDELGVNIIEAGFASVSEGEMEAIRLIANEGLQAEICSCSRGIKNDIQAVVESGADSVHIVIPTSDLHLQYKLKKTKEDVLKITQNCVQYAKDQGLKVELSAEDATRSDIDFVKKVFSTGIAVGADRICVCDTVGVLTVEKAYKMFSEISETYPSVPISVHCHNDFGMAVANSIAALKAGASEVHATINGLGERAGNASLEELVVALKALYNLDTSVVTKLLYGTSRLVAQLTGISVQPTELWLTPSHTSLSHLNRWGEPGG